MELVIKDFSKHTEPSPITLEKFANFKKAIDDLRIETREGFNGVHARQDKTNGNVIANTMWRLLVTGGFIVTNVILLPIAFIVIKELLIK